MSSQGKQAGFIVALIGGAFGLIAFFAMPFLTVLGFVSITAQQVTSLAAQYTNGSSGGQAFVILWLAPILSGIAVLVAALQFRARATSKKAASGWLIALGVAGVALYIGILAYTASLYSNASSSASGITGLNTPSIFSLLGAGFWVYILAMIAVIVGGAMGVSGSSGAPVVDAPPVQPLPYQQPWTQPPMQPPMQSPYPTYPAYPEYQESQDSSKFPPVQPPE